MKSDHEMYQSLLSRYDEYQEKKKKRFRMIRFTAPAIACFCLAVSFGISYYKNFVSLNDIAVQPSAIDMTAAQNADVLISEQSTNAVTANATIATSVSMTEKAETQPFVSDNDEYETNIESDYEIPAETEIPASTEQFDKTIVSTTAAVTSTTVHSKTAQTEAVTETNLPAEKEHEKHIARFLASYDPITNFPVVSFDSKEYEGYKYINASHFSNFYICWTEETVLNTFSENMGIEITEPVIINGLRDKEFNQEYIIIYFKNYNMYGLYWAVEQEEEEQPSEEQHDNKTLINNE